MAEPGRLDRSVLTVVGSFAGADAADWDFWWAHALEKRLQTIQYLREVAYGDAAAGPVERVIEFTTREAH